jgi:hypothetical protein
MEDMNPPPQTLAQRGRGGGNNRKQAPSMTLNKYKINNTESSIKDVLCVGYYG